MNKKTKMQIVKGQPVIGEGMLVQNTGYWTTCGPRLYGKFWGDV